jgi:outer membrane protein assembly factor BamB
MGKDMSSHPAARNSGRGRRLSCRELRTAPELASVIILAIVLLCGASSLSGLAAGGADPTAVHPRGMSSGSVVRGANISETLDARAFSPGRLAQPVATPSFYHLLLGRAGIDATRPPPVWHLAIAGRGTPVSDEASVYFVTEEHELIAVCARDGTIGWRTRIGEATTAISGSSLVLSGPLVIAGDYDVVAFERSTGAIRWRFHPEDGYGPGLYLGGARDGVVTAGSPAGRVYALEQSTGRPRWSTRVAADGKTSVFRPVISDDIVVAGYTTFASPVTGGLVALSLASGEELWRRPFSPASADAAGNSGATGGPIVVDGTIIAADGTGTIHGFDLASGTSRWSIPWLSRKDAAAETVGSVEFRALAEVGGTLFAGSLHGNVSAYDLRTLKERWRYYDGANGSAGFEISIAGDRLFVPFVGAGLVQLRAGDGQEIWRIDPVLTGLAWPPAVSGQRIYVASRSGLLAFEEPQ